MRLGSRPRNHMVDLLFVLALLCVFAASALMVVLIGANVYQSIVSRMDQNFSGRTTLAYIATKVRQNDTAGGVRTQPLPGGGDALVLRQDVSGQVVETWIYHHDGALREVVLLEGGELDPESGQMVVEAQSFAVKSEGGLLKVTVEDADGNRLSQRLAVRCGLLE